MKFKPLHSFDLCWTAILLVVIASLYCLLTFWTPLAFDDYVFMTEWRETNGDAGFSPSALFNFWKEIRIGDNGRIANVLDPVFTVFPAGMAIFPFITGLCVAAIICFVSFFSFSSLWRRPLCIAVVWCVTLFFLPWRNSLFVTDYALNYIWAATVTMSFMVIVVRFETIGWSGPRFFAALILAFLSGGWHEGFAIPTLGGFLLFSLIPNSGLRNSKFKGFSPQWWILGCFYALVTLFFYICPGMLQRTAQDLGQLTPGIDIKRFAVDLFPVIAACALIFLFAVVPSLRRRLKESWRNRWFVIATGTAAIGTLLSLIFKHQPRSAFWPDIMAIVLIFILTGPIWRKLLQSQFSGYLTIVTVAVTFYPFAYILPLQYDYYNEDKEIVDKMKESESGTVFHDIIPPTSLPVFSLKIPTKSVWVEDFQYASLGKYLGKKYPAVVPAELKTDRRVGAVPVNGTDSILRIGDSFIITAPVPSTPLTSEVTVSTLQGEEFETTALILPYLSPQGEVLAYVLFHKFPSSEIDTFTISQNGLSQ